MNTEKLSKLIFETLTSQTSMLSESDILKIEKGTHELSIKLVKKKNVQSEGSELSESHKEGILSRLRSCASREDGHEVISESLKNKKELDQFARYLDVLVLRQDKVDQIKDKIIEATVGAKLRSIAIQGKNITRDSGCRR